MGTLTINTTAPQDARIVEAFGARLDLGRDATGAEIKAEVIDLMRKIVKNYENDVAAAAAKAAVTDLSITP